MNHSYEFHGYKIVESCGDYFVYRNKVMLGKFDTSKDAEDFILEILWFLFFIIFFIFKNDKKRKKFIFKNEDFLKNIIL